MASKQVFNSPTEKEAYLHEEVEKFLDESGYPYFWCNEDEQKEWCSVIARHFFELWLKTNNCITNYKATEDTQ